MQALEVLRQLNLGNSVAEFDEALEKYFVETESFRMIISDQVDIVAGDKGTGKTALFRILERRYTEIEQLNDVEVIAAFNINGNPIFQRLNESPIFDEGQYGTLWKSYFLALAGNWILTFYGDELSPKMKELKVLLERTALISSDDSPSTVFSMIVNLWRRIMNPKAVDVTATITPEGIPLVATRFEFGDPELDAPSPGEIEYVPHDEAFALLESILAETELHLWLALDRLDEAFAGRPDAEIPALRALLRTYLDLTPYPRLKLKLFVRKDLFRRVTAGGFVNLTHVNARRIDIEWDEASLLDLLYRRIRENADFVESVGCKEAERDCLVNALLPPQVDAGKRKPNTWTWMMSRIADGNEIRPPRNLIDLVQKTLTASIRREEREQNEFKRGRPLLHPDAFKQGLSALSDQRVNDTLLAEAGERAYLVERFRGGKAEHNRATLARALAVDGEDLDDPLEFLGQIGFLGRAGASSFKVPMLYRDGLGITQGKAFAPDAPADEEDE